MTSLPIDGVIPDLLKILSTHQGAVLQAAPGAGKTTRVPLALLSASWLSGKIIMLEPRRLAAVNAARWMSSLLGETEGKTIGYAIRHERKVSSSTRIEVVTEGILTRRIQNDPLLEGISLVIFDEFHERNLNSDLALALCRDVQQGLRPDLKLLVMSATLESSPVAHLLGDVPVISSQGRSFPVEIRYLDQPPKGNLPEITAGAVQRALGECQGDILVFLPGAGEINRCRALLADRLGTTGPHLCPLYADLPFRQQELAILPADRRKVVLATTIAETSLTIEGVSVVVDAGWSRQPRFDAGVGLPRLETIRVSRAAADQRAGRAGRLGPGVCYRLWTEHIQQHLVPFNAPEITATELSSLALELSLWGVADPRLLSWLDPPPTAHLDEARRLLIQLGAMDDNLAITALGRHMATTGLHPRLARLLLAGESAGFPHASALLCALISERDIFRRTSPSGKRLRSDNDLMDRFESFNSRRHGFASRGGDIDELAMVAVARLAGQLVRRLGNAQDKGDLTSDVVARLLLRSWPDRIASQRGAGSDQYVLATGRGARLSRRSALHDEPLLVAVEVDGDDSGEGRIHLAAAVTAAMIRQELGKSVIRERCVEWDDSAQRVRAHEVERVGSVLISTRQVKATDEEIIPALLQGVVRRGIELLPWPGSARQFRQRVDFCRKFFPDAGLPDLTDAELASTAHIWLTPWIGGCRSLADVGRIDLNAAVRAILNREQLRLVDEAAPTHLTVPSGSRIPVAYDGDEPVLSVKLQELFGLDKTPVVALGRQPILLHLLSPAGRPIQVTRDLRGFWESTYREVKKELNGRYPKHPWPDDPWSAIPTRRTKPRG